MIAAALHAKLSSLTMSTQPFLQTDVSWVHSCSELQQRALDQAQSLSQAYQLGHNAMLMKALQCLLACLPLCTKPWVEKQAGKQPLISSPEGSYRVCIRTANMLNFQISFQSLRCGGVVSFPLCPGFGWDRVNVPPSSCCVLDLVGKDYW